MLNCKQEGREPIAFRSFTNKLQRSAHAFSLIEMSLVLAIMGTVAGLSMPMLLEQHALHKQQKSQKNIEIVLTALGTYAASNQHLPCPASSTSQGEPLYCHKDSKVAAVGFLPYKALGIDERSCKDGFGHPLHYALDPSLSFKELFQKERRPNLFIKSATGENLISNTLQNDRLAVVIVAENNAYQDSKSAFETLNLDHSSSFIDAPFSTQKENPFRQHVRWSTRNNLLTRYGKSAPIILPQEPERASQTSPQPAPSKQSDQTIPNTYKTAPHKEPYRAARRRKMG